MSSTITVKDKKFAVSIPAAEIQRTIDRMGAEMNRDLEGKDPLFISVLNGAFMFAADLMKRITIPCQISFIKFASYHGGLASSGEVTDLIGLQEEIKGRTVVIVEDIIDTGNSMQHLLDTLQKHEPKEVLIAPLLIKPDKLEVDIKVDYEGMRIPNDFILGYGLDYDGYARNLQDIYTLVEE
jgi:hypoxanthine phosphoribosyltransferase